MYRDTTLLSDIERRFRSGEALSCNDKSELKQIIVAANNDLQLQSALYLFGMSFKPDKDVVTATEKFIFDKRVPGLTAVSLKVLADFWGDGEKYLEAMESYLNYDLYDDIWYDEVIVSASFFARNKALQTNAVREKLEALANEAEARGEIELLDLLKDR